MAAVHQQGGESNQHIVSAASQQSASPSSASYSMQPQSATPAESAQLFDENEWVKRLADVAGKHCRRGIPTAATPLIQLHCKTQETCVHLVQWTDMLTTLELSYDPPTERGDTWFAATYAAEIDSARCELASNTTQPLLLLTAMIDMARAMPAVEQLLFKHLPPLPSSAEPSGRREKYVIRTSSTGDGGFEWRTIVACGARVMVVGRCLREITTQRRMELARYCSPPARMCFEMLHLVVRRSMNFCSPVSLG